MAFAEEESSHSVREGWKAEAGVESTELAIRNLGAVPGSATDLNMSFSELPTPIPVSWMAIYTRDDKRLSTTMPAQVSFVPIINFFFKYWFENSTERRTT